MVSKVFSQLSKERAQILLCTRTLEYRARDWWTDVEVELAHRIKTLGLLTNDREKAVRIFGRCTSTMCQMLGGRADAHIVPIISAEAIDDLLDDMCNLLPTPEARNRFRSAVPISFQNKFMVLGFGNDSPESYNAFYSDLRDITSRLLELDRHVLRSVNPVKEFTLVTSQKIRYSTSQLIAANARASAIGMTKSELGFLALLKLLPWLKKPITTEEIKAAALHRLKLELNASGIKCYDDIAVIYPSPEEKKLIIPGVKFNVAGFRITGFATLSEELEEELRVLFEDDDCPQNISLK